MANIKGYRKPARQDTLASLISLYNMLEDEPDANESYAIGLNDIGKDILNSFDDVSFGANMTALNNYKDENLSDFDENNIELYGVIKNKATRHQEKYTTFNAEFEVLDGIGRELTDRFNDYNEADPIDKGKLKDAIVADQVAYIDQKEHFIKRYSDFLTNPQGYFQVESNRINTYDNMFQFGLDSIAKDDNTPYFVDPVEFDALSQGITQGNSGAWNRLVENEEKHLNAVATGNKELGMNIIAEVNVKGDFLDRRDWMGKLKYDMDSDALPDDVREASKKEYEKYFTQEAFHLTEKDIPGLEQKYYKVYTYGDLLGESATDLSINFDDDIDRLKRVFAPLEEGFSNASGGFSILDTYPTTYSKWQDRDWLNQSTTAPTPGDTYRQNQLVQQKQQWQTHVNQTGQAISFMNWKKSLQPSTKTSNIQNIKNEKEKKKVNKYIADVEQFEKNKEWLENNPRGSDMKFVDDPNNPGNKLQQYDFSLEKIRKEKENANKQIIADYQKIVEIDSGLGTIEKSALEEIYDLSQKHTIKLPKFSIK